MEMQEVIFLSSIDMGLRLSYVKQLMRNTSSNVILCGYRGYSLSEGSPS